MTNTDIFKWYKKGLYLLYLNETKDKVVAYSSKNFGAEHKDFEYGISYMESFINQSRQFIEKEGFERTNKE